VDHNDEQIGPFKWAVIIRRACRGSGSADTQEGRKGFILNVNGHWRSRIISRRFRKTFSASRKEFTRKSGAGGEGTGVSVARGSYTDISDSFTCTAYFDPRRRPGRGSVLGDVFRIASGEPISERVIQPGPTCMT